jgi:branched-chain amino acid transport system substrate-binding protein
MKTWRALGYVVGLAGALTTFSASAAETLKIGLALSITGPASALGDPQKKVIELYADKINKTGGVIGKKVELIVYDDAGLADRATTNAKRLVQNDNVDVIIGGTTTSTTMAIIGVTEKAGVPFVSLGGASIIVNPIKKSVFKISHNDSMTVEKVYLDMRKRNIKKIALISEDAGYGKSGRDQSVALAASHGIEVVADEVFAAKDPDVTAQLTRIRQTPDVQALFVWGFGPGPVIVTKNYRQLGMTLPLYQSSGVANKEYVRMSGEAAEGVRLPVPGLVVAEQLPSTDPQKAVVTEFKKEYETNFKKEVSSFAGYSYDALQIVLGAVRRAGTTDKARIRDEIEKTSGYIGTAGRVFMSPTDHLGLDLSAYHMVEVKNGDWMLLD